MNANQSEITAAEVKMMFDDVARFAGLHGRMQCASDDLQFFGPEEWLNYFREYNEPEFPEEWVGDTGNTDPGCLVVPVGIIMDEECSEAVTWGVYRNAGIGRAANFIAEIPSFGIPPELRAEAAKSAKRTVSDYRRISAMKQR